MSVQNQTVKNVYDGNGSATVFPFTFALNDDDGEHVGVYVTNDAGTSESTDNFTIDAEAKTVTYPKVGDPLPVGKKIVIRREIPNEQDLNLENLGPFFAEDIEGELDKEVMMIQQLAEEVNRAVKVDMASNRTPDEFMQDIADAVEQAKDYADEASDSADDADASVTKAATWAEGTDADVSSLGGTHSAKGWADESHTYANESEIWDEGSDMEVQALGGTHSAQTYAYQAGESVTAAAGEVTKAQKWAEGSDADVSPLGGTHSAKGWANETAQYVSNSETWAEGNDADVAALGGTHSSKGWTDVSEVWAEGSDAEVQALGGTHSAKGWSEVSHEGFLTREQTPAFNHRDVIITSGTYTAPVSGWYRITVKGGGGGGQGGEHSAKEYGGGGGGEGGTTIAYERIAAGATVSVTIGAGGIGSPAGSVGVAGGDGGNSSVVVNSNTYTGGGGGGASDGGGLGGSGTIVGASGLSLRQLPSGVYARGANGAGAGGAISSTTAQPTAATSGGGGAGGSAHSSGTYAGGNGGDGYVWFEYFDGSLNP